MTPSDAFLGMDFGFSVAIDDQSILVGARGTDNISGQSDPVEGAVYVFDRLGNQLRKLLPNDSIPGDEFGFSVDIDGNYAIVGAPSNPRERGAAYVFDVNTGRQLHKLIPPIRDDNDDFGLSVAIQGTHALVGAPGDRAFSRFDEVQPVTGSAYLFDIISGELVDQYLPQLANSEVSDDEFGNAKHHHA